MTLLILLAVACAAAASLAEVLYRFPRLTRTIAPRRDLFLAGAAAILIAVLAAVVSELTDRPETPSDQLDRDPDLSGCPGGVEKVIIVTSLCSWQRPRSFLDGTSVEGRDE